jgi:hypothetical protein
VAGTARGEQDAGSGEWEYDLHVLEVGSGVTSRSSKCAVLYNLGVGDAYTLLNGRIVNRITAEETQVEYSTVVVRKRCQHSLDKLSVCAGGLLGNKRQVAEFFDRLDVLADVSVPVRGSPSPNTPCPAPTRCATATPAAADV